MSKKPRYSLIGAFVLGACVLVVSALLFFGSGKFFKTTRSFVVYFSGSVKGLTVGAPVNFRGVRVGSVKQVNIVYKESDDMLIIPTIIELEIESIKGLTVSNNDEQQASGAPLMSRLIKRGLRAQLALESIVTGQLYVLLDFFPESEQRLLGIDSPYFELPTVQSSFEELLGKIEKFPLEEVAAKLDHVLGSLDKLLSSEDMPQVVSGMSELLEDSSKLVDNFDKRSGELLSEAHEVTRDLGEAANQATVTLEGIERALKPSHPVTNKLIVALDDVSAAARALKRLADYLQQHPEALLRGKK